MDAFRETVPFVPEPIITLLVTGVHVTGPASGLARMWANDDARRCTLCPKHLCTFTPTSVGFGICFVASAGFLNEESAPLFARHG